MMKKTLMMMAIAACAVQAQAANYTIWKGYDPTGKAPGYSSKYGEDSYEITADMCQYYSVYAFTGSDLDTLMGDAGKLPSGYTMKDVTNDGNTTWEVKKEARTALETWLTSNLGKLNNTTLGTGKMAVTRQGDANVATSDIPDGSYWWVVIAYQNEDGNGFRISQTGEYTTPGFSENATDWNYYGDWFAATVGPDPIPEPTSGMLMLLGLAGLALKRKRA